ncbi:hypothetical protein V6N13_147197 [Hibiscus sabdariffa]
MCRALTLGLANLGSWNPTPTWEWPLANAIATLVIDNCLAFPAPRQTIVAEKTKIGEKEWYTYLALRDKLDI